MNIQRIAFGALMTLAAIAACTADTLPPKGQLMLAVTTNLAPTKDFDRFDLTIVDGDNELKYGPYELGGSQPTKLPATFAVVAGSDPNRAVRIKLEASRAGKARISREAIVRVPQSRIATLPLPIDGLCADTPTCPPDANNEPQTCIAGRCETAKVDETKLPTYSPGAIFGGGTGNGDGQCFDTLGCFANGKEAPIRREDCSIAKELGGSGINVAVVRPFTSDGVCAPMACLIPLDRDPFTDPGTFFTGWREDGDRVRLPPGVCDRSFPVMVSTSCPTKNAPTCGLWFAVGPGAGLTLPIPFDAAAFGAEGGSSPPNVPASLTFVDGDVREGFVKGNVVIGRAPDESAITGYRLYWADSVKKLVEVATLPKTGADLTHPLEAPMLAESSHLRVVSYSANAEIAPHLAIGPIDNFVREKGITTGLSEAIGVPDTLVDAKLQRLLIVGQDENPSRKRPGLVRCQLDGAGCDYLDLTNGEAPAGGARSTGAAIDETNDKLLLVADRGVGNVPALYRCNRDGSNCDGAKSLGGPASSAAYDRIDLIIDDANKKLIAILGGFGGGQIYRCDLDGNNCTYPTFGSGIVQQQDGDGVIDKVGNKLLVVRSGTGAVPHLFRCEIDGTSCGVKNISANDATIMSSVSVAIDEKNQKLIVVTHRTNGPTLQFYRCSLEGEGCITRPLADMGIQAPVRPHLHVDAAHDALFVFAYGGRGGYQRCALDGTSCTSGFLTATFGMLNVRAALHDGRFFVVGSKNGPGSDFATFLAY